ncbi:hypothetical protein ACFXDE_43525, partial [Kitasatospora sp. NPDC059408]|uniref:hypothetical protein n=1 Tax=Kitasatospora sp. NPDC059408 TaxID=3346823 RepID=UPI0036C87598
HPAAAAAPAARPRPQLRPATTTAARNTAPRPPHEQSSWAGPVWACPAPMSAGAAITRSSGHPT